MNGPYNLSLKIIALQNEWDAWCDNYGVMAALHAPDVTP